MDSFEMTFRLMGALARHRLYSVYGRLAGHTLNASRLDLRYHLEIASAWAFCKVSPRIYYKGKYTLASSFELYSTWGSLI